MSFWACAQLQPNRTRLARHLLEQRGFEVYCPQIRERRRRVTWLFPGYLFVSIVLQWHEARWCPGVVRLVMDGDNPAAVPPQVLNGIRARERNGFVRLPRRGPQPGDRVRIVRGPFNGHLAIYDGMSGPERVAVLLTFLGGPHRVSLPREDVEPV